MSTMVFDPLPIAGAFRIRSVLHRDERGFFARRFCVREFEMLGLATEFGQRSSSFNHRAGTLRGLHFQAEPHSETKLVRCTRGAAFDVLADLRPSSPTYGRWHGERIDEDNRTILYVPAGIGHGFQTLRDATEIDYEITAEYVPHAARGVRYDDPDLAIEWPVMDKVVSERDRSLPFLSDLR